MQVFFKSYGQGLRTRLVQKLGERIREMLKKWKFKMAFAMKGRGAELQKRANRANQLVLFFLAGANFWEKHAKNRRKTGAFWC